MSVETKPVNPPAFPRYEVWNEWNDDEADYIRKSAPVGGMTLRDYFAAKALNGLILHYHENKVVGVDPFVELSELAYQYADAMLAERSQS